MNDLEAGEVNVAMRMVEQVYEEVLPKVVAENETNVAVGNG